MTKAKQLLKNWGSKSKPLGYVIPLEPISSKHTWSLSNLNQFTKESRVQKWVQIMQKANANGKAACQKLHKEGQKTPSYF